MVARIIIIAGRGDKSLLYAPGSELLLLILGWREKERAKVINGMETKTKNRKNTTTRYLFNSKQQYTVSIVDYSSSTVVKYRKTGDSTYFLLGFVSVFHFFFLENKGGAPNKNGRFAKIFAEIFPKDAKLGDCALGDFPVRCPEIRSRGSGILRDTTAVRGRKYKGLLVFILIA